MTLIDILSIFKSLMVGKIFSGVAIRPSLFAQILDTSVEAKGPH